MYALTKSPWADINAMTIYLPEAESNIFKFHTH